MAASSTRGNFRYLRQLTLLLHIPACCSLHLHAPSLLSLWLPHLIVQVLGLTNYSHWDKAAEMRSCMLKDSAVAGECWPGWGMQQLLSLARRYLLLVGCGLVAILHLPPSALASAVQEVGSLQVSPASCCGFMTCIGSRPLVQKPSEKAPCMILRTPSCVCDVHALQMSCWSLRSSVSSGLSTSARRKSFSPVLSQPRQHSKCLLVAQRMVQAR